MKISVIDETTGERILRDMTADELAQVALDKADKELRLAEEKTQDEAKAALLTKLGITADEAALLLQ